MNEHSYAIVWLHKLTHEPTLETYETLEEALTALKEFRKIYPNNRYFLYNLLSA